MSDSSQRNVKPRARSAGAGKAGKAAARGPAARTEDLLRNVPLFQGVSKEELATVTAGTTAARASRAMRESPVIVAAGTPKNGTNSASRAPKSMSGK